MDSLNSKAPHQNIRITIKEYFVKCSTLLLESAGNSGTRPTQNSENARFARLFGSQQRHDLVHEFTQAPLAKLLIMDLEN